MREYIIELLIISPSFVSCQVPYSFTLLVAAPGSLVTGPNIGLWPLCDCVCMVTGHSPSDVSFIHTREDEDD
ncbi:hypothetical protein HZ326_31193 [Fusarium oxysporum f. sp. albedinis]|nr:hypothetical protein HZ326_31193 [Fusarium oxysporum f. sp. albedinis]